MGWRNPLWRAPPIARNHPSHQAPLPAALRKRGAWALLLHDIIEGTNATLPKGTPADVIQLVADMTFPGGTGQEIEEIWGKPEEVRLLKLYNKTQNLIDGRGLNPSGKQRYITYTRDLIADVEKNYPTGLNITTVAKAICDKRQTELDAEQADA